MAEKSAPGREFDSYWTRFIPSPEQSSSKKNILGDMLAGLLGGLSPTEEEGTSLEENKQPIAPPTPQYMPQTKFPEVFNQQYASPYAPAYTPEPVAPTSSPSSLQGFVKPPQYSGAIQPTTNMQGFKLPLLGQMGQTQSQYNDLTHSIWSKNNG